MSILDEFRAGKIELSDLVRHYDNGADVRELLEFAKTQPDRISALYVLSELGRAADPVWKNVVEYVADPEYHTSYAALRMVHQRARDIQNYAEVLRALSLVNLDRDPFFAKAVALLCSVPRQNLKLMLQAAMKDDRLGFHAAGLLLLIYWTQSEPTSVAEIFTAENKVMQLYLCVIIIKRFRGHEIEGLLPEMVKEDVTALRRTRDRAARESPPKNGEKSPG
jgi:hypothetical protein